MNKNLFYLTLLFLSTLFFNTIKAQNIDILVEYSPHLSNTTIDGVDFKFSHHGAFKFLFPATENFSFLASVGFTNTGYRFSSTSNDSMSTSTLTFFDTGTRINWNFVNLGIGSSLRVNKFVITPEVGIGILTEISRRTITDRPTGNRTRNISRSKPDSLELSTFNFSLSLVREIKWRYTYFQLGLRGYYSAIRKSAVADGFYGAGLLIGVPLTN